jgi:hypothetical protein
VTDGYLKKSDGDLKSLQECVTLGLELPKSNASIAIRYCCITPLLNLLLFVTGNCNACEAHLFWFCRHGYRTLKELVQPKVMLWILAAAVS